MFNITRTPVRAAVAALSLTLLAACAQGSAEPRQLQSRATEPVNATAASGGVRDDAIASDIAALRAAIDRFKDVEAAKAAGWSNQFPAGCMDSAEGAMGYHYLNESLVDGEVALLKPELLIYEAQADGSLELVAVEYIVPFDQWTAEVPPTLLDQQFGRTEKFGIYALHIWAWRDNPSGTFASWNATVTCEN